MRLLVLEVYFSNLIPSSRNKQYYFASVQASRFEIRSNQPQNRQLSQLNRSLPSYVRRMPKINCFVLQGVTICFLPPLGPGNPSDPAGPRGPITESPLSPLGPGNPWGPRGPCSPFCIMVGVPILGA